MKNVTEFNRIPIGQSLDILLVPLLDENDKIWSLQRIYPDKRAVDKIFLKNGRVSGLFFTIGDPSNERVVCEGFATGASINEATGFCVQVAFNAGNLKAVAKTIRRVHPDVDLFIAADDDHITDGNPDVTLNYSSTYYSERKLSVFLKELPV